VGVGRETRLHWGRGWVFNFYLRYSLRTGAGVGAWIRGRGCLNPPAIRPVAMSIFNLMPCVNFGLNSTYTYIHPTTGESWRCGSLIYNLNSGKTAGLAPLISLQFSHTLCGKFLFSMWHFNVVVFNGDILSRYGS